MQHATLIISQPGRPAHTFETSGGAEVSIGRALDNTLSLVGDERVAHYHALISAREGGGHWLLDLGSPHGTTVNGEPVEFGRRLRDGDRIGVGESIIEFYTDEAEVETDGAGTHLAGAERHATVSRSRRKLVIGAAIGLALTVAVAWLFLNLTGDEGSRGDEAQRQLDAGGRGARATDEKAVTNTRRASEAEASAEDSQLSLTEIEGLSRRLAVQISARSDYVFEREFIVEVSARTRDYLDAGFSQRASVYRDVVNDAFVGEQGLDASLGFVTALSRSRFALASVEGRFGQNDDGEGLWRLSPSLAQSTGYLGRCRAGTLADADQKCSAAVAAAYMKFLAVDLFAGDFVYAVACFGQLPHEAARFREGLGVDRRDFWKVLESRAQRERVVRFFAAGVVGENPRRFGLDGDRPLSDLYPRK